MLLAALAVFVGATGANRYWPDRAAGIRWPALPRLSPAQQRNALLVLLVLGLAWPFLGSRSMVDVATLALIYVILGLGLNIVVGFAGLLDLGYVGFYAVGAYTYALLYQYFGLELLGLPADRRPRWRRCSASCSAFRCCACAATTWRSSRSASAKSSACC